MFSRLLPIARGISSQRVPSLLPSPVLSRSSLLAAPSRGTFIRPLSSSFPSFTGETDAVKCHRLMALSQTGDIETLRSKSFFFFSFFFFLFFFFFFSISPYFFFLFSELLENGGGVNLLNYDKRSCLHLAVSSGQFDVCFCFCFCFYLFFCLFVCLFLSRLFVSPFPHLLIF